MRFQKVLMGYVKRAHSVYQLTYHVVFVTKYRRPVISDEIGDFMKRRCADMCGIYEGELVSAETDSDHIHILVSLPPAVAPSDFVRVLKTRLSYEVHENPEYMKYIRRYLHGMAPLWSPSYFIATTGSSVLDKVKAYIDSQRTDDHRRKYEKSGKYVGLSARRRNRKT